jgi:O6-methylguanine-DNA--protein-cysteine methyltransferase
VGSAACASARHEFLTRNGLHCSARPAKQLDAYFAGELREFDLPIRAEGTPLQRAVWSALGDVPFGTTISYGDLAARIDPDLFDPELAQRAYLRLEKFRDQVVSWQCAQQRPAS